MNDTSLDRLIRSHDAVHEGARDTAELRSRLDARLAELPAIPRSYAPAASPVTPTSSRGRFARRATGLVAAAAAVSTAYILLPGPGQENAYATWTATPQAVAERDRDVAADECREAQKGPFWARQSGGEESFDPEAATVALAERRGDLVAVILRDQGPRKDLSAFCVVELKEGASSGTVSGAGAAGSTGGPSPTAPTDGFFEGNMSQDTGHETPISMVDGIAGSEVTGITMHVADLTVQATVENGRYAAWFPAEIFPPAQEWGRSGGPGPEPFITYDITLADGTVITDAQPARP